MTCPRGSWIALAALAAFGAVVAAGPSMSKVEEHPARRPTVSTTEGSHGQDRSNLRQRVENHGAGEI